MNTHTPTKCIGYKGKKSHLQRPLSKKKKKQRKRFAGRGQSKAFLESVCLLVLLKSNDPLISSFASGCLLPRFFWSPVDPVDSILSGITNWLGPSSLNWWNDTESRQHFSALPFPFLVWNQRFCGVRRGLFTIAPTCCTAHGDPTIKR